MVLEEIDGSAWSVLMWQVQSCS